VLDHAVQSGRGRLGVVAANLLFLADRCATTRGASGCAIGLQGGEPLETWVTEPGGLGLPAHAEGPAITPKWPAVTGVERTAGLAKFLLPGPQAIRLYVKFVPSGIRANPQRSRFRGSCRRWAAMIYRTVHSKCGHLNCAAWGS